MSELEGVVLGIIDREGPCTAYRVRRALQSSPSTHWSASAGAIYPLLTRLVASGHVSSTPDPNDGRGRALLSLDERGKTALREWILEASSPDVSASVFDAVRSRAFFLRALSPDDRERFARTTLRALEGFLREAIAYEEARHDQPLERLAARGAVHAAAARVAWMREVHSFVQEGQLPLAADRG